MASAVAEATPPGSGLYRSNSIVLRAPAKLNLNLKIVGIRKNGYHELQSLFVPVTLFDEITITPTEVGHQIKYITENGGPLDFPNDTVSRALDLLSEYEITPPPLHIKILKRIPSGAGLGGGSSDAAAIIKYFGEDLSENDLMEVSLKIGADVPFFLKRGPAYVSGIGETTKSAKFEPLAVVIIVPPFSVSTKDAYGWFDQQSELTRLGANANSGMIREVSSLNEIVEIMENDLENPVEARHPEIGILKKALRTWGALGSLMSGSGSSVYGVFRSLAEATTAREKLQQNFPSTYAFFVCETL